VLTSTRCCSSTAARAGTPAGSSTTRAETDVLLRDKGRVPVFSSRAGLEHHAQEHRLELLDDLPDEIDLDLGAG
jgi:hypothetical protein